MSDKIGKLAIITIFLNENTNINNYSAKTS